MSAHREARGRSKHPASPLSAAVYVHAQAAPRSGSKFRPVAEREGTDGHVTAGGKLHRRGKEIIWHNDSPQIPKHDHHEGRGAVRVSVAAAEFCREANANFGER